MKDAIGDSLGLQPLDEVTESKAVVTREEPAKMKSNEKLDKDYDYARTNFYNVIESGTEALEQMLDVAKASEHPRAYEVVATIMKTLIDSNKELVAMSSKKAEDDNDGPVEDKAVTNNNLFVGSTAELQQVLKDMRNADG
mgnify:FL=1|jgi:hypothetical protein|tara:strand:- start:386 stop:805 length:420 start_codon:yes stop_codon:yes gene_type:complete